MPTGLPSFDPVYDKWKAKKKKRNFVFTLTSTCLMFILRSDLATLMFPCRSILNKSIVFMTVYSKSSFEREKNNSFYISLVKRINITTTQFVNIVNLYQQ